MFEMRGVDYSRGVRLTTAVEARTCMAMRQEALLERITTDPEILSGKLIIRGTRMPVWIIVELIEIGQTNEQITEDYPWLTSEDVDAVRLYMQQQPTSAQMRKL